LAKLEILNCHNDNIHEKEWRLKQSNPIFIYGSEVKNIRSSRNHI
jgi:hypothetical protein